MKIEKLFTERMSAGTLDAGNKVIVTDRKRKSAEIERKKKNKKSTQIEKIDYIFVRI